MKQTAIALLLLPLLIAGCDECSGVAACRGQPEVSYSGEFIEHRSGRPVAGVAVTFVRQGGVDLVEERLTAVTNRRGFFVLRAAALGEGTVHGELRVEPPPPRSAFTVPSVTLSTSRVRGAGGNLGRLVVDPYLLMFALVRDRYSLQPIAHATVTMRRLGGGRVSHDSISFTVDGSGIIFWQPEVLEFGDIAAEFTITAPGYPRPFVVVRSVPIRYQDGMLSFLILPVGSGLLYAGITGRRVTGEQLAGTRLEFRRIGGIDVEPGEVNVTPDAAGYFGFPLRPLADGTVIGEVRVVPPAPLPVETHTIELSTSDGDDVGFMGFFRYGAQVYFRAELRDAGTGAPLPAGTTVQVQRRSGIDFLVPPADSGRVATDGSSRIGFVAATADSGHVTADLIVRLPPPFAWDTISNVAVPALYRDAPHDLGVLPVRRRAQP